MSVAPRLIHITLDPPYRLQTRDTVFVFLGWVQVNDPAAPRISLSLNGIDVPVVIKPNPAIQAAIPGVEALAFYARVDFKALFASAPHDAVPQPFLLLATVRTDEHERTFEYEVTDDWLGVVFGRPMQARRIPPEDLQIRVARAAAGSFHRTGATVARQMSRILSANGRPLEGFREILDFGAGPGRVVSCIRELNPAARLSASDIDPEAIAWARQALPDVADFVVNPTEPPAPFPDETFDLIYAISVFTHLPADLQWAWLSDLRRLLKPGGILLTTKLDPTLYDLPEEVRTEAMRKGFAYWGAADETDGLPGFYRLAYHTDEYVRREWSRYFEVLHVGSHDLNGMQDAVMLRRPRHTLSWLPSRLRKSLHGLVRRGPA